VNPTRLRNKATNLLVEFSSQTKYEIMLEYARKRQKSISNEELAMCLTFLYPRTVSIHQLSDSTNFIVNNSSDDQKCDTSSQCESETRCARDRARFGLDFIICLL
jgi:hypothetical protein